MMFRPKIILARGLPGSGRTNAINDLRKYYPGMVYVDADPPEQGEDFSDPEKHEQALSQATADIELFVEHGIKVIAVETSTPSSQNVRKLISPALAANYALEITDFAINEPFEVMSYVRNSSHKPDPGFLYGLVAKWEEFDLAVSTPTRENERARERLRRKEAWSVYAQALAAVTEDEARVLLKRVFDEYPDEAEALMLIAGPQWGRLNLITEPPAFPWARVSPYWKDVENESAGIVSDKGYGRPKKPRPTQVSPEQRQEL